MKKKALLLASMGVLACTVGIAALAVGGANQLDTFPVKANQTDSTGYEITFNESNTTVKKVGDHYAIYTTTASGNKVGVVGYDSSDARFTFNGVSFFELWLDCDEDRDVDYDVLANVGAYDFDHITGFEISFTGGSVEFIGGLDEEEMSIDVESRKPYNVSMTPSDLAGFTTEGDVVTVDYLTIWYSC